VASNQKLSHRLLNIAGDLSEIASNPPNEMDSQAMARIASQLMALAGQVRLGEDIDPTRVKRPALGIPHGCSGEFATYVDAPAPETGCAECTRLRNDIQELTCGDPRLACPNCRPEAQRVPQAVPCSCTTYCMHSGYPDAPIKRGVFCKEARASEKATCDWGGAYGRCVLEPGHDGPHEIPRHPKTSGQPTVPAVSPSIALEPASSPGSAAGTVPHVMPPVEKAPQT
jgi:hypothetical protein